MSAEHRICWVLVCDACRTELHDPDEEFVPHFDTVDAATDHALTQGWQLDTDGHTYCHHCVAIATCLADGHDYTPWMPCVCQGAHPGSRPVGLRTAPLLPTHRLRRRRDRHPRHPPDDRRTHHASAVDGDLHPRTSTHERRGCR